MLLTRLFIWLLGVSFCCLLGCNSGQTTLPSTTEPNEEEDKNDDEVVETVWAKFESGADDNILNDYSYAGYRRGEQDIPDVETLGYRTYNITDFGAIANDNISDREAFIAAGEAIKANGSGVLYIPEGVFDIHTAADPSQPIIITTSNLILKGAGRNKSILRMTAPMQPADPAILYSSPVLINLKHNSTISPLTDIVEKASKGSFVVKVASTSQIRANDWVCLRLSDNSEALISQRLGDYRDDLLGGNYKINTDGIQVWEYHQVRSISGNYIEFYEPLMHEIDDAWHWSVNTYPHYEGVGVEDLTFEGSSKDDFLHHASWQDDGAYKPINLMRLTNSWMRRVNFKNVSEASSIVNCANVSVYDILIEGNKGHSAIRAQCSTRTFLGRIKDYTGEGAGQFHSTGVSRESIGTVIWRCEWGFDSCFESHASQPRATLLDVCSGAFKQMHQGGDFIFGPSHMEDLTIWNFHATSADPAEEFKWWESSSFKFLPPIIVGFHGAAVSFDSTQIKLEESPSSKIDPESLYEAQLIKRLGALPLWMIKLK